MDMIQFLEEVVGKTRVISASESRSGEGIQVRISIPSHYLKSSIFGTKLVHVPLGKTHCKSIYIHISSMSNVEWKDLPQNRKNEKTAAVYYGFKFESHNFQDVKINSHLVLLTKKVYEAALAVYRKGAFKRIASAHKLNQARKLVKENLLWALQAGLSEKEIRKLLKEACCQDLISS